MDAKRTRALGESDEKKEEALAISGRILTALTEKAVAPPPLLQRSPRPE